MAASVGLATSSVAAWVHLSEFSHRVLGGELVLSRFYESQLFAFG